MLTPGRVLIPVGVSVNVFDAFEMFTEGFIHTDKYPASTLKGPFFINDKLMQSYKHKVARYEYEEKSVHRSRRTVALLDGEGCHLRRSLLFNRLNLEHE